MKMRKAGLARSLKASTMKMALRLSGLPLAGGGVCGRRKEKRPMRIPAPPAR